MAGAHILFYSLAKFDTVHDRHHDITDNDVGNSCLCQFPAFFTILGSDYFIEFSKRTPDIFPYVCIVFYHQYNGMILGWCIGNGGFLCIHRLLFHIMLGMDSVGIRILGEQAQRECGSRIHCAFYFQDSFVQFAQTFDQSEPDSRTRCLIFAFCLIIAIENVW